MIDEQTRFEHDLWCFKSTSRESDLARTLMQRQRVRIISILAIWRQRIALHLSTMLAGRLSPWVVFSHSPWYHGP